jgi:hypothetical protein
MLEKQWFEKWYTTEDPWKYKSTTDDLTRKNKLIAILNKYGPFTRALDIGCGEGYVTVDIPAKELDGIEISDLAASRLPSTIRRIASPVGTYDLVMTTGTLYKEYDHAQIADWISSCATKYVLVAGVKNWLIDYSFGTLLETYEFEYRSHLTQQVLVYEVSA